MPLTKELTKEEGKNLLQNIHALAKQATEKNDKREKELEMREKQLEVRMRAFETFKKDLIKENEVRDTLHRTTIASFKQTSDVETQLRINIQKMAVIEGKLRDSIDDKRIESIIKKLDKIDTAVDDNKVWISKIRDIIDGIEDSIDNLDGNIGNLVANIS